MEPNRAVDGIHSLTIGEALVATTFSAPEKAEDQSDTAAIQAAEVRATGTNETQPGGVGATAQAAANYNASCTTMRDQDKTTLSDVLAVIILI